MNASLIVASRHKNLDIVKNQQRNDVDLNKVNEYGYSALVLAVSTDNLGVVKYPIFIML